MSLGAGLLVLLCVGADRGVELNPPEPRLLVGKPFERAVIAPISASWNNVDLRRILRGISNDRKIAIVLDRRIDPTTKCSVDLNGIPLTEGLTKLAAPDSSSVCVAGNTVVIGPAASVNKLRTLIQLRRDEMFQSAAKIPQTRLFELNAPATFHYGDLETPRDVISQIADEFDLNVNNVEVVPHDLWAGATLPDVDAPTALSLVLNQFDLTFEWTDAGRGIKIIPVLEAVWIELSYSPRKQSPEEAAADWSRQIVGLTTEVNGKRVRVRGTVEQHEALAALLNPRRLAGADGHPDRPPAVPLSNQRFTLTLKRIPVDVVMEKLKDKGVAFEFDADALAAAGVSLKTPITIDVKQVPADEFFHAIFDPLKVAFTIDGATVTLEPQ